MFEEEHPTISEQIARKYTEKVDEIIKHKIVALSYEALKAGDYQLYDLLNELDKEEANQQTIIEFRDKISELGYLLDVEIPKADISIDDEDYSYQATLDPNEFKVHLYKRMASV